jgi:branched-chain amino acid transport system permease protein
MTDTRKNSLLFAGIAGLIILSGTLQSWNTALQILQFGLISAIMALGLNMQWGYAGLMNVGVMGFVALGGLATVLVSMPPIPEAWRAGGPGTLVSLALGAATIFGAVYAYGKLPKGKTRAIVVIAILTIGFFVFRAVYDPNTSAIESVNPALQGYMGGLGLPVLLAWPVGGLFAAGAAWVIGKTALGLRSDYLAIATLGISEIIIAVMKNEDWLARGVKNINAIPRPVPYEIDLQASETFVGWANWLGVDPVTASTIYVKLAYSLLFTIVLVVLVVALQLALKSPWGRMMRAIRDNETAARAMGKNVTKRHLQIFVLGSAVLGVAGAMMTTLDSLLTPGTYQPLRFTFLIWVMVIIGGSGNNLGAVLGGMLVWFFWIQVEPLGTWFMQIVTSFMADGPIKDNLINNAAHMRLMTMGIILLLVLRFSPRGLIPEK